MNTTATAEERYQFNIRLSKSELEQQEKQPREYFHYRHTLETYF
jgi:hypothetical protein